MVMSRLEWEMAAGKENQKGHGKFICKSSKYRPKMHMVCHYNYKQFLKKLCFHFVLILSSL